MRKDLGMAKEEVTVSVVGVGAKDCMVIRSLLNLANGRGGGPLWSLTENGRGDLTLVDVDSEAGQKAWERLQTAATAIALSADKQFAASARLHKPLRAREFFAVLENVAGLSRAPAPLSDGAKSARTPAESRLEEATPAAESVQPQAPAVESGPSAAPESSGRTLADHLRLQTWNSPIVLTHPGWPMLPIDPGSGAWFFDGAIGDLDLAQFALPIPESAGVALTGAELVERVRGHRQRLLSELKWYAGLAQMPGKLHPDLRSDLQFMLVQIPGEAMDNPKLHALAQLVLRGPLTLKDLLNQSGQPEVHVFAFLNACYASGKLLIDRDWRVAGF